MRKKFECTKSECTKIVRKSEIDRKFFFERPKNRNAQNRHKNWTDFENVRKIEWIWKMHKQMLPMLGTNLIDWKKSAAAKYWTQRLGQKKLFWKLKKNSEIRKIRNSEIRKRNSEIRKRIRKIGNSEIRKWIRRLNEFWKMLGKSDLIA